MGCHFLLRQIFPTQGWYLRLLHWQTGSFPLSHLGSPRKPFGIMKTLSVSTTGFTCLDVAERTLVLTLTSVMMGAGVMAPEDRLG